MPNVAVHKAGELKAETRAAVEAELGRSLRDDEEVSIMAFTPQEAPASPHFSQRDGKKPVSCGIKHLFD